MPARGQRTAPFASKEQRSERQQNYSARCAESSQALVKDSRAVDAERRHQDLRPRTEPIPSICHSPVVVRRSETITSLESVAAARSPLMAILWAVAPRNCAPHRRAFALQAGIGIPVRTPSSPRRRFGSFDAGGAVGQGGLPQAFANMAAGLVRGWPWWWALAALLVVYLYAHYAFASLVAHVTAMFPAFLAVAIGLARRRSSLRWRSGSSPTSTRQPRTTAPGRRRSYSGPATCRRRNGGASVF